MAEKIENQDPTIRSILYNRASNKVHEVSNKIQEYKSVAELFSDYIAKPTYESSVAYLKSLDTPKTRITYQYGSIAWGIGNAYIYESISMGLLCATTTQLTWNCLNKWKETLEQKVDE